MTGICPLCSGARLTPFIERRRVPVHQNLLMTSPEAARTIRRGDLRLAACLDCGFVTNTAFDPNLLQYGAAYDNDQSCSACFENYVDDLIEALIREGARGKRVVEIGCGKGYFLTRLCERGDNVGVGVDATYTGPASALDGRVSFIRDFYRESHAALEADVIVCRHVIEHVPDPLGLLRSVRLSLDRRPAARAYFETPELRWILKNVVVQDFFYEHCSYFTADSLAFAFRAAGFTAASVSHVFDGQYLLLAAAPAVVKPEGETPLSGAAELLPLLETYGQREREALQSWSSRLRALRENGTLAIWGAGAKGVTFLNLLDPQSELVDCVVDVNPRKQGHFLPGTGHPIVSPAALRARGARSVVVMNRNYANEVHATIAQSGLDVSLHVEGEP